MMKYDYELRNTDENVDLYYELKKNLSSCDYINLFISKGYRFYYQGSRPVFDSWLVQQEELIKSERFKLIFGFEDSKIYELDPCKLS
jgi:hypothetical protein